ncbi:MAG: trigger factor [Bacteroidetes bacterium]|nr:trigger factor [Bacteroidota bacterium]
MATVSRENIGLLSDKISIKLNKEDYLPSFDKKIKEYSKTANVPGFRKGMVPAGMIKKMYGQSIFIDEVLRSANNELIKYLDENKPDIFAQPLPVYENQENFDFNSPSEYQFDFEIGLKPEFTLPDAKSADLTRHKINVTDEMVEDEVNRLRIKGGEMTEPEEISEDEDVVNVLFKEADENGNVIENGIEKENSVLLKYFSPALQQKLKGLKKGDKITFNLKDSFEADKLNMMIKDLGLEPGEESEKKNFVLEVVKIGRVVKRNLQEDFFNEVLPGKNIKTEEEFRENIKKEIEDQLSYQTKNQLHDQIYHFYLDNSKIDLPESFLKKWLQNGGEKPKSAEEVEREFPTFSNQLKWTLISDKLMDENKIEVKAEEIREAMRNQVLQYFGTMNIGEDMSWLDSYLDKMMKDEKQVDETYRRLSIEKLFNALENNFSPKEKVVSNTEFAEMLHHHHH